MAFVRILIDGYSLIHQWEELAPGQPRHSAAAREELVHCLTQYQDASGTPISVFFDGGNAPRGAPRPHSTPDVEVLFSKSGQTADQMIERTTYRLSVYGEVLVVTDDHAERDTVTGAGGAIMSCAGFIQDLRTVLGEFRTGLTCHNRRERRAFQRSR